jgi:hypothetical protein
MVSSFLAATAVTCVGMRTRASISRRQYASDGSAVAIGGIGTCE